jgi:hypothetical protein
VQDLSAASFYSYRKTARSKRPAKKTTKKQFFVVSAKEIMSFFQVLRVSMVKYFRTVAYRF